MGFYVFCGLVTVSVGYLVFAAIFPEQGLAEPPTDAGTKDVDQ